MVARKGQPSLGHDPGKRGGWEYRAVRGINKEAYARGYYQAGASFFVLLRRAAKARGINTSAYLRRAVAAFIARDLGIPFEEVLKDSASPDWANQRGEMEGKTQISVKTYDDGTGYGTWEVK